MRSFKPAAALVVTVLSVAAAGCATSPSSSAGGTPATSSSGATQGKLKSIFFANPLPAYPDWGTANKCFYAEVKKFGLTGVSQGPTGLQINDQFVLDSISQALAEHYSAMIVVPITPSEYQPIMQRARARA